MADCIKREDAITALENLAKPYYKSGLVYDRVICAGINTALREVQSVPAVDVRPVVLCENCIYLPNGTCRIPFLKSDESYCSWGRDYRDAQDECDSDSCPIKYDPDEFFSAERSDGR